MRYIFFFSGRPPPRPWRADFGSRFARLTLVRKSVGHQLEPPADLPTNRL